MKRLLAVLVLALPVLVGSSGIAGAGNSDQRARGRATGNLGSVCAINQTGTFFFFQCININALSFSATANFNGTGASGRAVFENTLFNQRVTADVTCLTVSGNNAVIGGVITDISPSLGSGAQPTNFRLSVQDVAKPGDGVDQAQVQAFPTVPNVIVGTPPGCPAPGPVFSPIINGDILVDDGSPTPSV